MAVVIGGVFNSGLLADPRPGATFDYAPAPPELVERAGRLQAVCARHGVPLRAAALAFPFGHPAVASVLVGARTAAEVQDAVATAGPRRALGRLVAEGLLPGQVPVLLVMRRVDAHHHLWDPARGPTRGWTSAWRRSSAASGRRTWTRPPGRGIGQTVVVQTVASVEETKEFLAVAGTGGRVAGVVGWVDLTAADVADAVAALRAAPGGEVLVGIRHQVHDEPDPAWLLHGEVLAGLAAVAEAGLAYDLLVRERELPAARRWPSGFRSSASSSTTWPSHGFVRGWSSRGPLSCAPSLACPMSPARCPAW